MSIFGLKHSIKHVFEQRFKMNQLFNVVSISSDKSICFSVSQNENLISVTNIFEMSTETGYFKKSYINGYRYALRWKSNQLDEKITIFIPIFPSLFKAFRHKRLFLTSLVSFLLKFWALISNFTFFHLMTLFSSSFWAFQRFSTKNWYFQLDVFSNCPIQPHAYQRFYHQNQKHLASWLYVADIFFKRTRKDDLDVIIT